MRRRQVFVPPHSNPSRSRSRSHPPLLLSHPPLCFACSKSGPHRAAGRPATAAPPSPPLTHEVPAAISDRFSPRRPGPRLQALQVDDGHVALHLRPLRPRLGLPDLDPAWPASSLGVPRLLQLVRCDIPRRPERWEIHAAAPCFILGATGAPHLLHRPSQPKAALRRPAPAATGASRRLFHSHVHRSNKQQQMAAMMGASRSFSSLDKVDDYTKQLQICKYNNLGDHRLGGDPYAIFWDELQRNNLGLENFKHKIKKNQEKIKLN